MAGHGTCKRLVKDYCPDVLSLAAANGIPLEDLPLIINGCSGGFSAVYRLMFGRAASCEDCCDLHDLRYQLGGGRAERKRADVELRECAKTAGGLPDGWRAAPRRAWRWFRAWVMYAAVRAFGASHWAG